MTKYKIIFPEYETLVDDVSYKTLKNAYFEACKESTKDLDFIPLEQDTTVGEFVVIKGLTIMCKMVIKQYE